SHLRLALTGALARSSLQWFDQRTREGVILRPRRVFQQLLAFLLIPLPVLLRLPEIFGLRGGHAAQQGDQQATCEFLVHSAISEKRAASLECESQGLRLRKHFTSHGGDANQGRSRSRCAR